MTETTTTTTCDICQRVIPKADVVFTVTRVYAAAADPGAFNYEIRHLCESCTPEKVNFLFPAR